MAILRPGGMDPTGGEGALPTGPEPAPGRLFPRLPGTGTPRGAGGILGGVGRGLGRGGGGFGRQAPVGPGTPRVPPGRLPIRTPGSRGGPGRFGGGGRI